MFEETTLEHAQNPQYVLSLRPRVKAIFLKSVAHDPTVACPTPVALKQLAANFNCTSSFFLFYFFFPQEFVSVCPKFPWAKPLWPITQSPTKPGLFKSL